MAIVRTALSPKWVATSSTRRLPAIDGFERVVNIRQRAVEFDVDNGADHLRHTAFRYTHLTLPRQSWAQKAHHLKFNAAITRSPIPPECCRAWPSNTGRPDAPLRQALSPEPRRGPGTASVILAESAKLVSSVPRPTVTFTTALAASIFFCDATKSTAPLKHVAQPRANSCSGFTPSPEPPKPLGVLVVETRCRLPRAMTLPPARPPLEMPCDGEQWVSHDRLLREPPRPR